MEWLLGSFLYLMAPHDPCSFEVRQFEGVQVQRLRVGPDQLCTLIVTPTSRGLSWRTHAFFESGLFLTFFSFGDGDLAQDTASRTYYFFPRIKIPTYEISSGALVVLDASGRKFYFSTTDGVITAIEGMVVDVAQTVKKANLGGFRILSSEGFYLDNGFSFGELPYTDEDAESKFYVQQQECKVTNRQIFRYHYKKRDNGSKYLDQVSFRYTDQELEDFLSSKFCL